MTIPEYSITISPASIFLLQNRPRPWMADLKGTDGGPEHTDDITETTKYNMANTTACTYQQLNNYKSYISISHNHEK